MNNSAVLRIGQLHYHLKRCGVRTVIDNLCRALIAHSRYDTIEIDLITSDADSEHAGHFIDSLHQWAQHHTSRTISINAVRIPELAYHDQPAESKDDLIQKSNHLLDSLIGNLQLDRCSTESPYFLHTHNANLGKNPILTLALKQLADHIDRHDLPLRILCQMHDFAEDNRPDCWKNLVNCTGRTDSEFAVEMMYPSNSCIHWACINSADVEKLSTMGLPPDHITLLPNALDTDTVNYDDVSEDIAFDLKARIAEYAKQNGFFFHPERNILLAPIKAIRRKNILESVLLLILLNHPHDRYQLLITLRANSPDDIDYCRDIEDCVRELRLPVVIGFGEHLIAGTHRKITHGRIEAYSLADLMGLARAIVTTSIQEGFGYIFHEPWLAGKSLIGRDIPQITRDFTTVGMDLSNLYPRLLVPSDWLADQWPVILETYTEKITRLRQAMNLPAIGSEQIINGIQSAKTFCTAGPDDPKIDFADLPAETQTLLIKDIINNPEHICQVLPSDCNGNPLPNWHVLPDTNTIRNNQQTVIRNYNFASIAAILDKTFETVCRTVSDKPLSHKKIDNSLLLENAIRFDKIRLIR